MADDSDDTFDNSTESQPVPPSQEVLNEYAIIDDQCVTEVSPSQSQSSTSSDLVNENTRKNEKRRPEMTRRYSISSSAAAASPSLGQQDEYATNLIDTPSIKFPRVNCPEKIIICLDLSSEMESLLFKSRAGDKFSPMKLIKRALGIYLQTKSQINRNHEYALIALHGDAVWVKDFTKDPKEVVNFLDDLSPKSFQCDSFDIGSLFEVISNHVVLPVVNDPTAVPPPFTARAILFYGRSHCVPSILNDEGFKLLNSSPYFFIDAFYVHEPASDDNKCEEVFNFLCDLDTKERSYIFEVAKNLTRVYDHIAQLLAHPLQRPYQKDLYFKINSLRDG